MRVQLKRHNFGQCKSFRGLVDIPRMCFREWVLLGDVRFGRYEPTEKKQISAIAAVDVLLSHDAKVNKPMWAWHAVRRCVCKWVNSCVTCTARCLRAYIAVSHRYTATTGCTVSGDSLQYRLEDIGIEASNIWSVCVYVCEQLPGTNSSPIVTKLCQSYPWPQGTRWLNLGRSRSEVKVGGGQVCTLLSPSS